MKGFQYSFQKILDLKSNTKRQSEWILAEAMGKLQTAEQSLSELLQERDHTARQIHEMTVKCASVFELQWSQQYLYGLDERIGLAEGHVKSAKHHVHVRQKELEAKMIDEKVWSKAREKAEAVFKHEALVAEQYEMDEMATVRYYMATH